MSRILLPVHYRIYGGPMETMCGLVPGRNGKGYRKLPKKPTPGLKEYKWTWQAVPSDVPDTRVKVKVHSATCAVCLTRLIRLLKRRLRDRLKATRRTLLEEHRLIRAERNFGGMKRLVGAG